MGQTATRDRGALIDGRWRELPERIEVSSPYDHLTVGHVARVGGDEARESVAAAAEAMQRPFPPYARAEVLDRLAASIVAHAEEFARLLALEAGKPLRAGRMEAARAASTISLSAVEARKLAGDVIPMGATQPGVGKVGFTLRVPVGVVAAITPFNFPLNLACHKIGPAIAAGCGVVLKPADKAPLAAYLLAELAVDAGVPPGLLNVIVGDPGPISDVFCADPSVGLITFTGSSAVGWDLRARAPRKRVSLELGNVTPVILDDTSDPSAIAPRLTASAFGFSGQSCISTQRVLVHESVADQLAEELAAAASALVVGDPLDEATDVGPVITADAAERVMGWTREAVDVGGRVLAGGTADRQLVAPTVIADVPQNCKILQREVFGPIVAIERYTDFDDAVARANSTDYGLQAGVFTQRLDRALDAATRLEFGGVLINEVPTFRADQMPYGGVKESGNTREGPPFAVREMTEERLVLLQPR